MSGVHDWVPGEAFVGDVRKVWVCTQCNTRIMGDHVPDQQWFHLDRKGQARGCYELQVAIVMEL